MFEGMLEGFQNLDYWSMGIGIILTVIAFAVFRMKIWKRKDKKEVK
ncbi:MAG: hypothetical protein WC516_08740 [Patescibacteria group bacterium]|jgi:uncharacterized membrane protein